MEEGMKEGVEKVLQLGLEKKTREMIVWKLKEFPDWSDVKTADFVGSTEDAVYRLRKELEELKQDSKTESPKRRSPTSQKSARNPGMI